MSKLDEEGAQLQRYRAELETLRSRNQVQLDSELGRREEHLGKLASLEPLVGQQVCPLSSPVTRKPNTKLTPADTPFVAVVMAQSLERSLRDWKSEVWGAVWGAGNGYHPFRSLLTLLGGCWEHVGARLMRAKLLWALSHAQEQPRFCKFYVKGPV